jgi:hypothetical protein
VAVVAVTENLRIVCETPDVALELFHAIERAIKANPDDGPVYEDEHVTIYRVGGLIHMRGKSIRVPFIYR